MRAPARIPRAPSRSPARQRGRLLLGSAMLLVTTGCASVETESRDAPRGASRVVTWTVSDIGRVVSSDNQRIRWSYLITLRNPSDRVIQLERVERATTKDSGDMIGGTPTSQPFWRALGARSDLRIPASDDWGWARDANRAFGGAATLSPIMVSRRFRGTDDRGMPVEIQVRIRLDSSVGLLVKPPTRPQSLPAPTTLESARDLARLVGLWRGSYRPDNTLIDVPIAVTVLTDGTFEFAENEPATNHFSRPFQVKGGALDYTGSRGRATLTLHEGGGKRMLVGHLVEADVRLGMPSSPEARYAIYLEPVVPPAR